MRQNRSLRQTARLEHRRFGLGRAVWTQTRLPDRKKYGHTSQGSIDLNVELPIIPLFSHVLPVVQIDSQRFTIFSGLKLGSENQKGNTAASGTGTGTASADSPLLTAFSMFVAQINIVV